MCQEFVHFRCNVTQKMLPLCVDRFWREMDNWHSVGINTCVSVKTVGSGYLDVFIILNNSLLNFVFWSNIDFQGYIVFKCTLQFNFCVCTWNMISSKNLIPLYHHDWNCLIFYFIKLKFSNKRGKKNSHGKYQVCVCISMHMCAYECLCTRMYTHFGRELHKSRILAVG